jgi:gamma-glutamylcyclotransferase (GGCT)/AIG2-like uncharacterized protein YtfP
MKELKKAADSIASCIYVYGTLREGQYIHKSGYFSSYELMEKDVVLPGFRMYTLWADLFPSIFYTGNPKDKIYGDIITLGPEDAAYLDRLEIDSSYYVQCWEISGYICKVYVRNPRMVQYLRSGDLIKTGKWTQKEIE